MSLPTPVQDAPQRNWGWWAAGGLALLAALLFQMNRGADRADDSKRRRAEPEKIGSRYADLRRLAETVHLRYIESDVGHTPAERLERAIQRVARDRGASPEEVRAGLERYSALVQAQSGRNDYEAGLVALIRGDFEGVARAWPRGPEAPSIGVNAPNLLEGYLAAADAHAAAGRYEDAVRACGDAKRSIDRARDPESWARVQAALFIIEFNQNHLAQAYDLAREVLQVREQCLPADSPGIANALLNLGVCLARRDEPAEAVPLYERAIAIYQKAYGSADAAVADAASELASVLLETERLPEAEKAARHAISIYAASGGAQKPRMALALDRLGTILLSQQRPADAEPPLRQAVAIYDQLPNPRAKDHADAQHRLGLAIARAGRRREALPHLKRSTVLAAKFFADDDPLHATYYHNLAVWADAAGDDPGTVEAYTKALKILALHRSRTGQRPPQMEQTASFYAEYLRRSGVSEPDIVRRQREATGE